MERPRSGPVDEDRDKPLVRNAREISGAAARLVLGRVSIRKSIVGSTVGNRFGLGERVDRRHPDIGIASRRAPMLRGGGRLSLGQHLGDI